MTDLVAQFAHAVDHLLDDSEENAQTGVVTLEISKDDWRELMQVRERLGDDPHQVLHDLIGIDRIGDASAPQAPNNQSGVTLESAGASRAASAQSEASVMRSPELEQLRAVAISAKALVESATGNALFFSEETVGETEMEALERALDAAGYGMTDEEFAARMEERRA